jgi:hypothetical protein
MLRVQPPLIFGLVNSHNCTILISFSAPGSKHEALNKRKAMKTVTQLDGPSGTTTLEVRIVQSLDPLNIESNRAQLMALGKSTARGDAE